MSDFSEGQDLANLLARANDLGIVHTEYADDGEGGLIERRVQDVEPLLNRNKELQLDNAGWWTGRDEVWVAEIPFAVAEGWCREAGLSIPEFMAMTVENPWLKRKLEDPSNRFLRVWPGRL